MVGYLYGSSNTFDLLSTVCCHKYHGVSSWNDNSTTTNSWTIYNNSKNIVLFTYWLKHWKQQRCLTQCLKSNCWMNEVEIEPRARVKECGWNLSKNPSLNVLSWYQWWNLSTAVHDDTHPIYRCKKENFAIMP